MKKAIILVVHQLTFPALEHCFSRIKMNMIVFFLATGDYKHATLHSSHSFLPKLENTIASQ